MNIIKLADLAVGSTVIFRYDDTSYAEFIVVHQGKPSDLYDDSCDGTWFMMKDMIDISAAKWDSTDNDYENSNIYTLLKTTIYNRFD